ncbi:cubilin homolog [Teleopsis dalmanni]|uniref:cubilin homolog n=1 Tax=Teleopsis dalmanni TaxID=139649 RepID=UPI0018CF12E5|nr:cubilin homolog [Teleopsis dalmanni]
MFLDLEEISDCSADNVRVFSSSNLEDWHEELKVCNSKKEENKAIATIRGTPYLKVEFKSDASINGTGFSSFLTTECGSNITNSNVGTIIGNHVMRSRLMNFTCLWHIEVRPGKQISVEFKFNRTISTDKDCAQYAIVYDGLDSHAPIFPPGHICQAVGHTVNLLTTSTNHAIIKYVLPFSWITFNRAQIWNITYREYSECDEEIYLTHYASYINISSPRYPNVPHPHTECKWIIIGPPGETLQLSFIDRFDMNTRYCDKEFIEIFDGATDLAPNLGRFCRRPNIVRSTSNILTIHYFTDIAEPHNGFRVNASIARCGGSYNSMYGDITSSNYPALGAYPKNTICEYSIKLIRNARMILNFTDLHIPFNNNNVNNSDHLDIFRILDENTTELVTVIYGNETLPQVEIDAKEVLIIFSTFLENHNYRGFKINYKRISSTCYRYVSGLSGNIELDIPRDNSLPTFCRWKITVPKGQVVRFELLDTDRFNRLVSNNGSETSPPRSQVNYSLNFKIFNSIDSIAKITEFYFEDYNSSNIIQSTDNLMYIQIRIGRLIHSIRKIHARYSSDHESHCPVDIPTHITSGFLSVTADQFNYTNFYCRTQFYQNGDQTLTFNISSLVYGHSNTYYQISPVRFKDEQLFVPFVALTSNASNMVISSSAKRGSIITFQTEFVQFKEFMVNFRRHECGGVQQLSNGFQLKSPEFSIENYGPLECVWILRATYTTYYHLNGTINFSDTCDREYLVVYAGPSNLFPEIGRFCRDVTDFSGTSTSKLFTHVLYHAENFKTSESNFILEAQTHIICGSTTAIRGQVSKISVDSKTYKNNMECSWEFDAANGYYLVLSFVYRFFIEDSENCTNDQLEIQTYEAGIWVKTATFCGRESPESYNTKSKRIRIVFRTNNVTTGDGFTINVHSTCNVVHVLTDEFNQVVETTRLANSFIGSPQCEVTVKTETEKLIIAHLYMGLRFSAAKTCNYERVTAYVKSKINGTDISSGVYCNDAEIRAPNYLRLVYSGYFDRGDSLKMEFKLNSCGGNITSPTVIYPLQHEENEQYADNMNCIWYLRAAPDQSIVVKFKYLDMEESFSCSFDYIALYSGTNLNDEKRVARLCGNMTDNSPVIMLDSNTGVINAVSDVSVGSKGFSANIIFMPNCNERITLSVDHPIVSLPRQFNVTEDLLCHYRILGPRGYRINIQLKQLHINNQTSCRTLEKCKLCNFIEILDSAANRRLSMGKYCEDVHTTISLFTSVEDALIKFDATNKKGKVEFEIVLNLIESECGTDEYVLHNNEILNIAFPLKNTSELYPPNKHCKWKIKATSNFVINFNKFLLQNASQVDNKCLDYLHIQGEYLSTYYCGNSTGFKLPIDDSEKSIILSFHSDEFFEYPGFNITIQHQQTCNNSYTKLNDHIDYYRGTFEEVHCVDDIRVPDDYKISFYMKSIFFNIYNCSTSLLKFIDLHTNQTLLETCQDRFTESSLHTNTSAVRIYVDHFSYIKIEYIAVNRSLPAGCGGEIYNNDGVLSSPYYDNDRNFSNCRWDIKVPSPNYIRIYFSSFDMGSKVNCPLDNVTIYKILPNGYEEVFLTLCGQNWAGAWDAVKVPTHDNLFNNLTGIIESPPVGSIATQEPYSWRIELPRDQLITLEFKEYLSGLNLYDGFSDIALKVEIPFSPWRFVSSTNVVFLNSINDELQPFLINWSAVSKEVVRSNQTVNKCGEDLIISFSTAVKLNSPGYPNGYDDNLHCTYIIKPEENIHHVVFELMFLDLEEISDCSADNVRVFSSSNLEDWHEELKVCNSKKEETKAIATIRGTPYLKVEFKSDASINGTGFSSFLTTECGSNITNSNVGTIIGNHVMRSRLMNFTCLWHIEVRPGKQISVEFKFNRTISTDKDCAQYAIVYDGLDSHAPIFPPGHICQAVGHTVNLLTTSTNHAIIKYVLPFSWITFNRAQIWNITYREYSECDEEIYLTHYASYINISSPRYPNVPHPHTECKWIIIGPPGETLQLSFIDRFDMNTRYCDKEFIEIFDGATDLAPNLGHFCRRPNIVRSTSNILTIHYFTDIAEPHNGFRVNASIARCGGSYNSMYGDITSLNYPALGAYPKNTICEYSIKLIRNARMILNFTDLHIPFNNNNVNNSDHLDIFRILDENTTELVTVIYGNETLPQVEIDGKEVLIIFSTFLENHNYRGFKINYKRISSTCYRYVSGLSGNIELDIPRDNSMPTFCRWKITVPKGQVVRFELLDTDRSYRLVSNNGSET